tara:strand:- start:30281 stop:31333 length:1053 start_codon:yes stop_codon:yes gene_type:complete
MKQHKINNPFDIAPNESLSGYLLRRRIFYFIKSPSYLIIKDKLGISIPNFPNDVDKKENQLSLNNYILKHHTIYPIIKPTQNIDLRTRIQSVFNSNNNINEKLPGINPSIKRSQLRFCPYCLEEQVINHGFSWLLRDWQTPLIKQCTKHKSDLIGYKCDCLKGNISYSKISKGIFTGECKKCGCNIWEKPKQRKMVDRSSRWMSESLEFDWPYLSNAIHKTFLHEKVIDDQTRDKSSSNLAINLLRKHFKEKDKSEKDIILKDLRKIPFAYEKPFNHEIFWKFAIDSFKSPKFFYNYLTNRGKIEYLNYEEIDHDEISEVIESCQLPDHLEFIAEPPSSSDINNYIRVIL